MTHDTIFIVLMVTSRCTFRCAHCMYASGPERSARYVSNRTLAMIRRQIEILRSANRDVVVVLNGGEPTWNLDEFKRVVDLVGSWDVGMEIMTNGWWAHRKEPARRLMEIVKPHLMRSPSFCMIVSNDVFHLPFRRKDSAFDLALALKRAASAARVPTGGRRFGSWLVLRGGDADAPRHSISLAPSGRARSLLRRNRKFTVDQGQCRTDILAYDPRGRLRDICCSGATCEFGSAADDPFLLLDRIDAFIRETRPTCNSCGKLAREWRASRLGDTLAV